MTIPRMVGVLLALTLVGLGVVALRVEQGRHQRLIQVLHQDQAELQQKIWNQELEIARLRSPRKIRERAEALGVDATPTDRGGIRERSAAARRR